MHVELGKKLYSVSFNQYTVFAPIFWGLPPMPILTCLGTGVLGGLLELLCEVVLTPVGYAIVKNWERDRVGQSYIDAHSTESNS